MTPNLINTTLAMADQTLRQLGIDGKIVDSRTLPNRVSSSDPTIDWQSMAPNRVIPRTETMNVKVWRYVYTPPVIVTMPSSDDRHHHHHHHDESFGFRGGRGGGGGFH